MENLGRWRSRNGRSRSDDAMWKYIESCRSGGLPDGSMAKEKMIFEKCLQMRGGTEIEATREVEVSVAIGQEEAASSRSLKEEESSASACA